MRSAQLGKASQTYSSPLNYIATEANSTNNLPARILFVDDERDARAEISEMLKSNGYAVSLGRSGKHAITLVRKNLSSFNLILLDLRMNGLYDGIDTAVIIQDIRPDLPIIVVSAFAGAGIYVQRAKEEYLKISGWIDKPVTSKNKEKLFSTIKSELDKQKVFKKLEDCVHDRIESSNLLKTFEEIASQHSYELLLESSDFLYWVFEKRYRGVTNELFRYFDDVFWPCLNYVAFYIFKFDLKTFNLQEFVAYFRGRLIDKDKYRDNLIKRLFKKFDHCDFFIASTTSKIRKVRIRRPMKSIKE